MPAPRSVREVAGSETAYVVVLVAVLVAAVLLVWWVLGTMEDPGDCSCTQAPSPTATP